MDTSYLRSKWSVNRIFSTILLDVVVDVLFAVVVMGGDITTGMLEAGREEEYSIADFSLAMLFVIVNGSGGGGGVSAGNKLEV